MQRIACLVLVPVFCLLWAHAGLAGPIEDVNQGVELISQGKYEEAVLLFDQVLDTGAVDDETRAVILFNRGNANQAMNNYNQAVNDYDGALALIPNEPEFLLNRANAYSRWGMFEEAMADYHTASQLNPRDARIYYNRAITLQAMGDLEAAKWDYDMARSLDPSLP